MESVLSKACTIKIANFEGPFDLLFHLIEKNKIDIYDIPISVITDQYMEYLFDMQQFDLEIASEFLVMAATLLHIKSRLLLPIKKEAEQEEIDPRDELVERLLEYKKFKLVSDALKIREKEFSGCYYKMQEKIQLEKQYKPIDITVYELAFLYKDIIERKNNKILKRARMNELIQFEKVTVKDKIREVLRILIHKAVFKFSEVFNIATRTKCEIVTGFMAVLELAKSKKVLLSQRLQFDDINVKRIRKPKELDMLAYNETASGIEQPQTIN